MSEQKKKGGSATSRRSSMTPPLKWPGPGGKHYLARRIVDLMPPHLHYVEPYGGGLAVLLAKDPQGVSEVANDTHGALSNFWTVLQGRWFEDFLRIVQAIPFSEEEFQDAGHPDAFYGHAEAGVNQAVAFFVRCRQSLAGRMQDFATVSRNRVRRRMNEQVSAWLTAVEGLPMVHARLKRVLILKQPALKVIRKQDGKKTLFYLDPPYLHETRSTTTEYGDHEMGEADHAALLAAVSACRGRVLLSGYRSKLYDAALVGWERHDFEVPNNAAGGKKKRRMVESLWLNPGR